MTDPGGLTSAFAVLDGVSYGNADYTQLMEGPFAAARSFRSDGARTVRSALDGSVIEV